MRDMEKLVFKKMRQLDVTAMNIVTDEAPLTSYRGQPRPVYPVIVIGSGFVLNPVVTNCIQGCVVSENLFRHAMIRQLSVIDLAELEMLEGLAAHDEGILAVLSGWHESGIANMPLNNWLYQRFGEQPTPFRPPRMQAHVTATFEDIIRRLRLRDGLESS